MTALTLYSIEEGLQALLDTEECVPAEQTEFRADLAEALKTAVEKRDRVAAFIMHCRAQAEFAAAEIERLRKRKEQFENAAERLREYVGSVMAQMGVRKLEGRTSTFSLRKKPDTVIVTDTEAVPAGYKNVHTEVKIDKRALLADLKAGVAVPGADLQFGGDGVVLK